MKEQVISVTVAARMFADCVNRVRYQGTTFLLKKNGVSVARIVPIDPVSGLNTEDVIAPLPDPTSPALIQRIEKETPQIPALTQRPILNW